MVMKEGFSNAAGLPDNQDPTRQFAIEQAEAILVAAGVIDPENEQTYSHKTYELLRTVRNPSVEERKFLTGEGFVFLSIEAKTLEQVVAEHPDRFLPNWLQYIKGLPYSDLRTYVPSVMEVAFNPSRLYIQGSINEDQLTQFKKTEEYSRTHLKELSGAKALMMPATVYAQADIAYFQMTGNVLFGHHFSARALDETAGSNSADVGRNLSDCPLTVSPWLVKNRGYINVGVPLAVVFIQK